MLPDYERLVAGELTNYAGKLLDIAHNILMLKMVPEDVADALNPIIAALSDRAKELETPL